MAFTYKQKIGKGMIEVEENDFEKLWSKASFLGDMPTKCSNCGGEDIGPMYKTPQNYELWGLRCKTCGAEQTFHKKKTGEWFIKSDDEFKKFSGGGNDNGGFGNKSGDKPAPPKDEGPENFEDDLPF